MKSFIDRNPKEKAVEQAFMELAQSGYVTTAQDPADKAFEVAGKLKRHATKLQAAKIPEADPDDSRSPRPPRTTQVIRQRSITSSSTQRTQHDRF